MGGDIRVGSAVGQGTLFAFDIQLVPAARPTQPMIRPRASCDRDRARPFGKLRAGGSARVPHAGGGRQARDRRLLVEWLQAAGFVVREAANGQEAVEIWERWAPG